MNTNLPVDKQDIDDDKNFYTDEVWEFACTLFKTEEPTEAQLERAQAEITDGVEGYYEDQL